MALCSCLFLLILPFLDNDHDLYGVMALTDFGNRPNFERSLALHSVFFFRVWQFGTLRTGHTASTQIGNHTVDTRERERESN